MTYSGPDVPSGKDSLGQVRACKDCPSSGGHWSTTKPCLDRSHPGTGRVRGIKAKLGPGGTTLRAISLNVYTYEVGVIIYPFFRWEN